MPAPPPQIHIKRKFEDEPLEFLHVHNEVSGNRLIKHVFMRKKPRISPSNQTSTTPAISFTGIRNVANVPGLRTPLPAAGLHANATDPSLIPTQSAIKDGNTVSMGEIQAEGPRRFYFSKETGPSQDAEKVLGKPVPKVFVERRIAKPVKRSVAVGAGVIKEQPITSPLVTTIAPDLAAVITQPTQAPLRNTKLPSGKIIPWDATATKLASEMQAYTLQEIGEKIAETSTPTRQTASPVRKTPSRFKPKVPALRYKERHPEAAAQELHDQAMKDADEDSGYVLDTYIRMPIEMFQSLASTKSFGLLVLDSQPDIDEFYNDDSDDESEIYDEEEDENAENHHSTDYPEDEIASDDEYDRNPYRFRNRNASDEEEFDEDDATFSDENDDEESKKPAWARRTWKMGQPLHDEDDT